MSIRGFQIIQTTNRWTRTPTGEFWRECVARRSDGELRTILVRDELLVEQ